MICAHCLKETANGFWYGKLLCDVCYNKAKKKSDDEAARRVKDALADESVDQSWEKNR